MSSLAWFSCSNSSCRRRGSQSEGASGQRGSRSEGAASQKGGWSEGAARSERRLVRRGSQSRKSPSICPPKSLWTHHPNSFILGRETPTVRIRNSGYNTTVLCLCSAQVTASAECTHVEESSLLGGGGSGVRGRWGLNICTESSSVGMGKYSEKWPGCAQAQGQDVERGHLQCP